MRPRSLILMGSLLLFSSVAFAQPSEPDGQPGAAATPPSAPKAQAAPPSAPKANAAPPSAPKANAAPKAQAAPPNAPKPEAAPASAPAVCLLGIRPKGQDDSARTAARLVCDELRAKGVPIGDLSEQATAEDDGDGDGDGDAYRVDVEPLGDRLLMRVAREHPLGTTRASRRLTLANYAEANVAAGRLAEALVHDKPLGEAATAAGATPAPAPKKRGETLVGLGLVGLSLPSLGVYAAPGAEVSLFHETPGIAFGAGLATAGGHGDGANEVKYVALSFGVRRYLARSDVAPYLGVGNAITRMTLRDSAMAGGEEGNTGLGFYAEGGAQFFRSRKHHLGAGLRLDAPLYLVGNRYVMPLTFALSWEMQ